MATAIIQMMLIKFELSAKIIASANRVNSPDCVFIPPIKMVFGRFKCALCLLFGLNCSIIQMHVVQAHIRRRERRQL